MGFFDARADQHFGFDAQRLGRFLQGFQSSVPRHLRAVGGEQGEAELVQQPDDVVILLKKSFWSISHNFGFFSYINTRRFCNILAELNQRKGRNK